MTTDDAGGDAVRLLLSDAQTGKTRRIADEVAGLLAAGVPADRILVVSLNDELARALTDQLDEQAAVAGVGASVVALTFNRLATRVMLEPGPGRLPTAARAIDDTLERLLLGEAIPQVLPTGSSVFDHLAHDLPFRKAVDQFILELKLSKIDPARFQQLTAGLEPADELATLGRIYALYHQHLRNNDIVDFRGAVWLALLRLQAEPAVRERLAAQWEHIFVDEIQDATPVEIELLAAVCGENAAVTLFGDPEQAIYGFRGALAGQVERCVRDVFDRWGRQVECGEPTAEAAAPAAATYALLDTVADEARWVAGEVRRLTREEGIDLADIAVLFRSYGQLRLFAPLLEAKGVPVSTSTGSEGARVMNLVVSSFLGLWRALDGLQETGLGESRRRTLIEDANAGLLRIANYLNPGNAEFQRAFEASVRRADRQRRYALEIAEVRTILGSAPRFEPLRALIDSRNRAQGEVSARLRRAVALLDLDQALAPVAMTEAMHCLSSLLDKAHSAEELLQSLAGKLPSAGDLLADLEGFFPAGAGPSRRGVSLLTAHQAKGRSFDAVFVPWMSEGVFPTRMPPLRVLGQDALRGLAKAIAADAHRRGDFMQTRGLAEDPAEALDEERRVLHLCMSRARNRVYLSAHRQDASGLQRPSPFLIEQCGLHFADGFKPRVGKGCPLAGTAVVRDLGLQPQVLNQWRSEGAPEPAPSSLGDDVRGRAAASPTEVGAGLGGLEGRHAGQAPGTEVPGLGTATVPPPLISSCPECPLMREPGACCIGLEAETRTPLARLAVPVREATVILDEAGYIFSATSLNAYCKCPRAFFLGEVLRLVEEEESDAMALGIVAHRVLRRIHEPSQSSSLEDALAWAAEDLRRHTDEFTSAVMMEYQRGVFRDALAHYFELGHHTRSVLQCEVAFGKETPVLIAGHPFTGRIDAVAEGDGGRVLVDYKTGRTAYDAVGAATNNANLKLRFTDPEAKASIEADYQLPIYALSGVVPLEQIRALELQFVRPAYSANGCIRVTVGLGTATSATDLSYDELRGIEATIGGYCDEAVGCTAFEPNPDRCNSPFPSGCVFRDLCQRTDGGEE